MSNDYKKTEVLKPGEQPGSSAAPPPQPPANLPAHPPAPVPPIQGGPQKTVVLSPQSSTSNYIGLLVFMNKDGSYGGRVMALGGRTIIGRDPQCDILVTDRSISAQHMVIRLDKVDDNADDDTLCFYVQDLATTNGTYLNGQKIIRHPLVDGDKIEIGDSHFVFKQV